MAPLFSGDERMKTILRAGHRILTATALATLVQHSAHAALSAEELAKLAQNPVGNMISVPIQNNTNLNFGPEAFLIWVMTIALAAGPGRHRIRNCASLSTGQRYCLPGHLRLLRGA
ncbi:MAG: hypothetical protein KDI14_18535 [Halioglobus sp.]|nr:hypothetical protein [Halioglobus sp.]